MSHEMFDSIDLGIVLWNVRFHGLGYRLMKDLEFD
jgi:hypothetical protein